MPERDNSGEQTVEERIARVDELIDEGFPNSNLRVIGAKANAYEAILAHRQKLEAENKLLYVELSRLPHREAAAAFGRVREALNG